MTHAIEKLAREVGTAASLIDAPRAFLFAARALPDFMFNGTRARLLRMSGVDVRDGVSVLGRVEIVGPRDAARNLRIGNGSIVGPGAIFCLDERITVGRSVSIGPRVMLYTATHALGTSERRMSFDVIAKPIVIEDGAWIGLAAMILPGVRIGHGAVVAAGSVVTKDVDANTLVCGNPASLQEQLDERTRNFTERDHREDQRQQG